MHLHMRISTGPEGGSAADYTVERVEELDPQLES
jgi:hypothetical protein